MRDVDQFGAFLETYTAMDALSLVVQVRTQDELLQFRRSRLFERWFMHEVDEMYDPNQLSPNGMATGVHAELVGKLYFPTPGCGFGREDVDEYTERGRLILEGPTEVEDVERTRRILQKLQHTCRKYDFPIPTEAPTTTIAIDGHVKNPLNRFRCPQTKLLHHLGILYYDDYTPEMRGWAKDLLCSPGMTPARILHAFSHDGWHMVDLRTNAAEKAVLRKELAPLDMESVLA